jgi:outer membrane translocation and assembly module TamA
MPANEIYRTRQMFTPEATWIIAQPLELSFGVSFARYRPSLPAAKTGSANAVVTTLRYHQRWGSDQEIQQEANADYSLRAATHFLETDAVYSRHEVRGHYKAKRGKSSVEVGFLAGRIDGNAPLYERFALGNASTLRGWNKFDLDPVGGSRAVHGSIDYHFDIFTVFYDTGAVWDQPQNREQKQSVGAGFNFKKGFQLAVAFPLRAGHTEPIFYAGMNF